MATSKKGGGPEKPPQEDRILARLVDDSTQITTGLTSYIGLLGRSPKEGYWLLYTTLDMSLTVEIREDDIVHSEQLPPDKSPFGSLGGTQVFVKKNAMVTTTRTASRTHEAGDRGDEFDLDIRLGGETGPIPLWCHVTATTCIVCPGDDGGGGGGGGGGGATNETCGTCAETCGPTCHTCKTDCNQATCNTCTCPTLCGNTCQTCPTLCGNTCNTCQTKCGQATCNQTCQTCQTKCGQATCNTCKTKCGQNTCQKTQCGTCPDDTCQACTHVTCFKTCDC